jgi:transcriptional regulator of heat shock response
MRYKQVIQVVDYTAQLLTKLLGERYQRGLDK